MTRASHMRSTPSIVFTSSGPPTQIGRKPTSATSASTTVRSSPSGPQKDMSLETPATTGSASTLPTEGVESPEVVRAGRRCEDPRCTRLRSSVEAASPASAEGQRTIGGSSHDQRPLGAARDQFTLVARTLTQIRGDEMILTAPPAAEGDD
jgi:hypothetical protein